MFNRFPKRGKQKKKTIMKKNANEIFMLQYRIKRYLRITNILHIFVSYNLNNYVYHETHYFTFRNNLSVMSADCLR